MCLVSDKDRDATLVREAKKGSHQAFEMLHKLHSRCAKAVIFNMLSPPRWSDDDRNDACQETWVRIWAGIKTLKDAAKFCSWASGIATNVSLEMTRGNKRFHPESGVEESVPDQVNKADGGKVTDKVEDLEWEAIQEEFKEKIRRIIESLPVHFRDVIILRYLCDLEINEIAELLGITEGTVRTRLARAEEWLRSDLEFFSFAKGDGWYVELIGDLDCNVNTEAGKIIISLRIVKDCDVTVRILCGRKLVRHLANNELRTAGVATYYWDVGNGNGHSVPRGPYTITAGARDQHGNEQKPLHVTVDLPEA